MDAAAAAACAGPALSAGLVPIALAPSPAPFSPRSESATELAAAPLVTISFVSLLFSAATNPADVPEEEEDDFFFFFFLFLLVLPPASFCSLELLPAATDATVEEVKEEVVSEASAAAVGGASSVWTAELPPEGAPAGEVGSTAEMFPFVSIVTDPLPSLSLAVNDFPLASIVTGMFILSVGRSRATFTYANAVVKWCHPRRFCYDVGRLVLLRCRN